MLNEFRRKFYWIAAALIALTLFTVPASALDLGQAKAQGLVKETSNPQSQRRCTWHFLERP